MVYYWEHDCGWVNYLDPYYFWNWKGNVKCAGCDKVAYFNFINGELVDGPKEVDEVPDVLPLYADNPSEGYIAIRVGTPGKTRPFYCLMRDPETYTGEARTTHENLRGNFMRAKPNQPKKAGFAEARRFAWIDRTKSIEIWMKDKYPGKQIYGPKLEE
jgi:hypothetical protein